MDVTGQARGIKPSRVRVSSLANLKESPPNGMRFHQNIEPVDSRFEARYLRFPPGGRRIRRRLHIQLCRLALDQPSAGEIIDSQHRHALDLLFWPPLDKYHKGVSGPELVAFFHRSRHGLRIHPLRERSIL